MSQQGKAGTYSGYVIGQLLFSSLFAIITYLLGPDYVALGSIWLTTTQGSVFDSVWVYLTCDGPDYDAWQAVRRHKYSLLGFFGTAVALTQAYQPQYVVYTGLAMICVLCLSSLAAIHEAEFMQFLESHIWLTLLCAWPIGVVKAVWNLSMLIEDHHERLMKNLSVEVRSRYNRAFPVLAGGWRKASGYKQPSARYTYRPLGPREFRILKLSRRSPLSPLTASLIHASIDDTSNPFEAISYCWGPPNFSHRIDISGTYLNITPSAYGALVDLSSPLRTRWVWIDSICIDQANVQEKGSQVAMMGDIYSRCSRTIVWLGNSSFSTHGLAYMERLLHAFYMKGSGIQPSDVDAYNVTNRFAMEAFFGQAWFRRVWVVQEVVLPRVVHVLWDGHFLDWDFVQSLAKIFHSHDMWGIVEDETFRGISNVARMISLRNAYQNGERWALAQLLHLGVVFEATNPRDKVFALQGITANVPDDLAPKYDEGSTEVYRRAARWFCLNGMLSHVLPLAGTSSSKDTTKLPSWVPDWSDRESYATHAQIGKLAYHASGDVRSSVHKHSDPAALIFNGVYVDEVVSLTEPCIIGYEDSRLSSSIAKIAQCQHWINLARRTAYASTSLTQRYKTSVAFENALWRTLIVDRSHNENPAPQIWLGYFRSAIHNSEYWSGSDHDFQTRKERLQDLDNSLHETLYRHSQRDMLPQFLRRPMIPRPKRSPDQQWLAEILDPEASHWDYIHRIVGSCSRGQRFCVTKNGYMGIVPNQTDIGDSICVILGAQTPSVLRRIGNADETEFVHVGECYVHGIMNGEAVAGQANVHEFVIR